MFCSFVQQFPPFFWVQNQWVFLISNFFSGALFPLRFYPLFSCPPCNLWIVGIAIEARGLSNSFASEEDQVGIVGGVCSTYCVFFICVPLPSNIVGCIECMIWIFVFVLCWSAKQAFFPAKPTVREELKLVDAYQPPASSLGFSSWGFFPNIFSSFCFWNGFHKKMWGFEFEWNFAGTCVN